jgi:alpha-L-arabinofuranosidase
MSSIHLLLDEPIGTINPNIYGHFAEHLGTCVYDGIWVGEESDVAHSEGLCSSVVEALRAIRPPVIRWPGGCFADDYRWEDGVGPRAERPRRVNIHWGDVVETNAFGTHEFIRFCRAIGAEPYLCGNVGSGTPRELRDWIEYCNLASGSTLGDRRAANGSPDPFSVRYWGVGNENWGCGGYFTPDDYGTEYRRYSTYARDFGGPPLYLIACGPNRNDLEWTRRFFMKLKDYRECTRIHGYAAHLYCHTSELATEYGEERWYGLLAQAQEMEPLVVQQRALMDAFDPERRIGLVIDEWGTWHAPTPGRHPRFLWQQNTLRDALVAALTLDIFNRHADKVVMANIAQTVNVLQALLLTEGDRVIKTPTYHVYDLYQVHQGAQSVRSLFSSPEVEFTEAGQPRQLFGLAGSASIRDGVLNLTVVNPGVGIPQETTITLRGDTRVLEARATVLTDEDIRAHNTVESPERLTPSAPETMPVEGASFTYTFAPHSVTRLELRLG